MIVPLPLASANVPPVSEGPRHRHESTALNRHIQLTQDHYHALNGIACSQIAHGEYVAARSLYKLIAKIFPGEPGAKYYTALALLAEGRARDAVNLLSEVLNEVGHRLRKSSDSDDGLHSKTQATLETAELLLSVANAMRDARKPRSQC